MYFFHMTTEYLIKKFPVSTQPETISNYGQIMKRSVTYASGMYQCPPKISSEIQIFNFGHPPTRHYILREDPWLFFEAKGARQQQRLGNTSLRQIQISKSK